MIKNKKNKGFSLIEAMILFTALSVILLAFVPVMIKRTQKVKESDCVGGLKAVRLEFNTAGAHSFEVPDTIASNINFTLVTSGAGGSDGRSEAKEVVMDGSGSCVLPTYEPDDITFPTNIVVNVVLKGKAATCSDGERSGGSSGKYSSHRAQMYKLHGYGLLCTPNGLHDSCTSLQNHFDSSSMLNGNAGREVKFQDDNGIEQTSYYGGIPGVRLTDSEGNLAGVGGSCVWNKTEGKYERINPTGASCGMTYNEATQGQGGAAGRYMKFSMSSSVRSCFVTVGKGGEANKPGEATTISCGNETYNFCGAGVGADSDCAARETSEDYYRRVKNYTFPLDEKLNPPAIETETMPNSRFQNYGAISGGTGGDVIADFDDTNKPVYSKGGVGGCYKVINSFSCINPNGKPGTLGSGGGGGSCNEEGCGVGGRGGDGLVIVEYQEFCK